MPVIGSDCHITLTHPSVNGGLPCGFLLDPSQRLFPHGWQIVQEVCSDPLAAPHTGGVAVTFVLPLLLADDLVNPDGTRHSQTRAQMYALLQEYMQQSSGITVTTPLGATPNLGAIGRTLDERHFADYSVCRVQLTNAGVYFPYVNPAALALSVWDGTLTWHTSYWR